MSGAGRRHALRALGALALLLGRAQLAFGASIVAVRLWPAEAYTRVTIESDAKLTIHHFMIDHPLRLVVDIDGLELSPTLRELVGKVRDDDPFIAAVRVGQNQPRVVRLVIDLKQPIKPQLFTLDPVASYQNRLVFDLYPAQEPDPLLALIHEKVAADRQAAQAAGKAASEVQDALGEFIGKLDKAQPGAPAASSSPRGTALAKQKIDRLIIVAIDPGHGGEDPGATGPSGLHEKDVVLAIGLKLRDRLNQVPGMRAMLTRDADFFVPLHERVKKARRVQADLFVSIHADAFTRPQARGASVFALSEHGATSTMARWMAQRENAADLVGGANFEAKDVHVLRAMLDMSTTAQIKDSLRLADEVLGQIGKVGHLHKAQVEQAGFAVLKAPDIPSILVETAFISNPQEERKLRSPAYQGELVEAISTGIRRYFAKNPPLARNRQL